MDFDLLLIATSVLALPPAFMWRWKLFVVATAIFVVAQVSIFTYMSAQLTSPDWNDSASDMFIPLIALLPTLLFLALLAIRLTIISVLLLAKWLRAKFFQSWNQSVGG